MDYLKYVNIKQGTKSTNRFSNGNTLPLVQKPFGFASFSPQTNSNCGKWFYHPEDRSFEGIRLTHQPSPWINDHAAMVIHLQSEYPYLNNNWRWSGIEPRDAILTPYYMKYFLKRNSAKFELTPMVYGACIRVEFDNNYKNYFSVLPVGGITGYRFDEKKERLYCYTDFVEQQGFDSGKFKAYYVFQFEKGTVDTDNILIENESGRSAGLSVEGEKTGIHIALKKKKTEIVLAESFISYKQAEINLNNDWNFTGFDELREANKNEWNSYLSRIEIETDEDTLKTFYSCMYRLFLFPHKAYEINENNEPIHYAPSDGSVKKGYRYTDNGFWDTYRTVYPLFSIIAKDECKEFIEGFIQDYIDGGWLPRWTSLDAKNCMPSTMFDVVIADAAVKGIISGELLEVAFSGMEKNANTVSDNPAYGRTGCEYYNKLGYVPYERYRDSVNLTLDAAYCDYCLSVVAEILGDKKKADYYMKRASNYKNLFDKETGFMRGKCEKGYFRKDFDPILWGWDYTEASAWQTTFAVQHDFDGLAELYGGVDKLLLKLDEFFETPPIYHVPDFRPEIHEMTEFAVGKWGQCAISNQPSFHIPFIYAYFGEEDKTNYWVERLLREAFSCEDDGFPGDEDNGTMAAWYIFSTIGIYPLCPGKVEYVKFKKFTDNIWILGKKFDVSGFKTVSYADVINSVE